MSDISGCSKDRDPMHIDLSFYDREVIANKYNGRILKQIKQCKITLEVKTNLTIWPEKRRDCAFVLLIQYYRKQSWITEQHMADRGLPSPTPKAFRAKFANQTKTKEPPPKKPPKQNPLKTDPPLEPRVVVVPVVPVDQLEGQAPLYPPNQPNKLPDIPPNQPDQPPNNPTNPPNNPPNPPPNLPNQPPNPPANPPNPMQPQNPPPQVPQLSWSYFKPEFSGKPEDAVAHLLRTNDWMKTHNFPEEAKVQTQSLPPQVSQLSWSYFKPEFSGKPEEDAVAWDRTNDWMETHNFPEEAKVHEISFNSHRWSQIMVWNSTDL